MKYVKMSYGLYSTHKFEGNVGIEFFVCNSFVFPSDLFAT